MKVLTVIAAMFLSSSAFAYNCVDYSKRAIAQENAAAVLACGYSGPRWQTQFQGHFVWCSIVGVNVAGSEDIARQAGLDGCLQKPAVINNCTAYAIRAVKQNQANQKLGCGFGGLRWQSNGFNHKTFCQSASFSAVEFEDQARVESLVQCVGK